MNVSILKICGFLLFLPLFSFGQVVENYEVVTGESIDITYNTQIFPLQVNVAPANGVHALDGVVGATTGFGEVTLSYTPNPGFIGSDQMILEMGNNNPIAPQVIEVYVNFTVVSDFVKANDDFYVLAPGANIALDVIDNDLGNGVIGMEMVSLANNVNAFKYGDQVYVKLEENFNGTAKFSYTICNADMTCDQALVTIFSEATPNSVDQLALVTNKEVSKKVLLPLDNGYQLVNTPDHGSLENFSAGSFDYTPNQGYTGSDVFEVAYNTNGTPSIRTFNMEVLDAQDPNNFAFEDLGHVSVSGMIDIDVLENDLGTSIFLHSVTQQATNGVATKLNGQIHYEPNVGFVGADHFKYKVCTFGFVCEITDVYVQVSNDEPSDERFFLTCLKNNPLVIDYPSDIPDFDFELLSTTSDEGGTIEYHPGNWTGMVAGQEISGYNLIIYTPATDFTGNDNFLVKHCVGTDCHQITLKPEVIPGPPIAGDYCIEDCVWPGDANADGAVNILDLLPIGYCTGEVGPERTGPTDKWFGQESQDWSSTEPGMVNDKHVDTDGDGHIMSTDLDLVSLYYGKYHQVTPVGDVNLVDLPLYFVNQTPNPAPGDLVQIDILLGTSQTPAVDITGLTFELNYNTSIVKEGSFEVTFDENSWLAYDSPVMDLVKQPFNGKVDAGYTRITGTTATGWGPVGTATFIIEDLIDGGKLPEEQHTELGVANPTGMNGAGQYQSFSGQPLVIDINYDQVNLGDELDPENLILYPNPTSELLNIHINGRNNFRRVDLVDLSGKMLYQQQASQNHLVLNIEDLNEGIYFLRAVTDKGVVTQKFEVFNDK